MQSTAIDQTDIENFSDKLKNIVDEDKKSKNTFKNLNPIAIAQNELNIKRQQALGSPRQTADNENNNVDSATKPRRGIKNNRPNYKDNEEESDDVDLNDYKRVLRKRLI